MTVCLPPLFNIFLFSFSSFLTRFHPSTLAVVSQLDYLAFKVIDILFQLPPSINCKSGSKLSSRETFVFARKLYWLAFIIEKLINLVTTVQLNSHQRSMTLFPIKDTSFHLYQASVCLFVCLFVTLYVCASDYLSLCLYLSVYTYVYVSLKFLQGILEQIVLKH